MAFHLVFAGFAGSHEACMKLGSFFPEALVCRDAWVQYGFPPKARKPNSACYALSGEAVALANANPNISAILTSPEFRDAVAEDKGCVISDSPQLAFYQLHNALYHSGECLSSTAENAIDPTARISPSASLGRHLHIGKGVQIGAQAVIEDFTQIGDESWIGPHVVVGGRGLQKTVVNGQNVFVEYAGRVRIGKRCEVLSGALIQRAYLCEETIIGDDTKVGPGSIVGHSCRVGSESIVGARAIVAGNSSIGNQVWIGAGAIISDGIEIGDRTRILIGSVVVRNVKDGESVSGNFALPHAKHLRFHTRLRHE